MPSQDDVIKPSVNQPASEQTHYEGLWRLSVVITSLVAVIPLTIMTAIDYSNDRQAFVIESRLSINRILSTTKRSMEAALENRRSALSFILSENSYKELADDTALAKILGRLQDAFGGFVDLGIVDSGGKQLFYSGPYDLKGRNYKEQRWFHEALLRGMCISEVFMGYRNFPHFVIALRQKKNGGGAFMFKTTLDMKLLDSRIYDLELDRDTDVFLVSKDNILQTPSVFYGPALQKADIEIPPHSRTTEVIEEIRRNGKWMTLGFAYIETTPFILAVVKQHAHPFAGWLDRRSSMFRFLVISAVLIVVVSIFISNRFIKKLREADARRAKAFHDLEYTNKLATIGRMAASVAHEINNPLAIINEEAGLIRDIATFENLPQKEKILKPVNSIQKSVDRCSEVTHRLLGFARRMDVRLEPIALGDLLKEVVSFQKTEIAHRNINIEYEFADGMSPIVSDRGKLQQVFINIISNALAAVKDGGKIRIRAAPVDKKHQAVVINDNGTGISEEDLGHIFEPFYSTKGWFGTGLGLSITHDIVSKLGGTIEVQSELGRGTAFIVTLPIKSK